jgi:hypothetical protein
MFENMVLRRIFGTKFDVRMSGCTVDETCSMHGDKEYE